VARRLTVVGLTILVWAVVVGGFVLAVAALLRGPETTTWSLGPRVAVVELEGVILDVDDLLKDLKAYRENPQVRAIVVRINSPGGVVGPSQELYDAIRRVRKAGKPVVASLGAVPASAGTTWPRRLTGSWPTPAPSPARSASSCRWRTSSSS
jgi:protease-4